MFSFGYVRFIILTLIRVKNRKIKQRILTTSFEPRLCLYESTQLCDLTFPLLYHLLNSFINLLLMNYFDIDGGGLSLAAAW